MLIAETKEDANWTLKQAIVFHSIQIPELRSEQIVDEDGRAYPESSA